MTQASFDGQLAELQAAVAARDPARAYALAPPLATAGQLGIVELIGAAQLLAEHGRHAEAIALYRTWLGGTTSEVAYAAWFNLAVLLSETGDRAGAETAYRAALAQNTRFSEAWLNLGLLLEHEQRSEEALASWQRILTYSKSEAQAQNAVHLQALNHIGRLQAATPGRPAGLDATGSPLVSVLIPTHNRPDYAEEAVQSVLAQTWSNLEIVISDNSDDELTRMRMAPYLERHACIRYFRVPGYSATENGRNCFDHARGEYINFLMDDDLFDREKLSRMMSAMLHLTNVALVTSFRQLIDAEGRFMDPIAGTERLFPIDTLVAGKYLGDLLLTDGRNLIGEPTTVLFRKSAIGTRFGEFLGRDYVVLSDVATWLSALSNGDCVYLPEALSYFRIHGGQDQQRGNVIRIRANVEWMQLLCDAVEHCKFMHDHAGIRDMLTNKLITMIWYLSSMHEDIKASGYDLEKIHALIRQATVILLTK